VLTLLNIGCKSGVGAISPKTAAAAAAVKDTRLFEMRVYYAHPGKLADLENRFRNHTTKIFGKHGMTNIGYWVPLENPENKLIYLLAYPNREARDASWKAFGADPEWKDVASKSEVNGKLVAKVDQLFLETTDYSPAIMQTKAATPRTFELRTYTATPGNLENLHARFREHTVGLFTKYGMEHVGYWQPVSGQPGADNTLIYILAHKSKEAGEASFNAFREDAEWKKVKQASEVKGGGSLTTKVESVYMKPTDYSLIQ
jgi:hypothetical protein